MVVSGHIHHFASFAFEGARPPQLMVGTGGDVGEPGDTPRFIDGQVSVDGMGAHRFGFERYGFLVLDRDAEGWAGAFYDVRDRPIARCRLAGRMLTCTRRRQTGEAAADRRDRPKALRRDGLSGRDGVLRHRGTCAAVPDG